MKRVKPEDLPHDFGWIDGAPDPRDARIAELETAIKKAVRNAEANGMGEWKVFATLRKAIKK